MASSTATERNPSVTRKGLAWSQRSWTQPPRKVLRLTAKKKILNQSSWDELAALQTAMDVKKYLKTKKPELVLEDAFQHRRDDHEQTLLVRIRSSQRDDWLIGAEWDWLATPMGPLADENRVIWDAELHGIDEMKQRYQRLPGYRGIIANQKGLGV